ncbi:MAG: hypothetical protein LBR29_01870 [Methylobacteriaceae bacterium]|jgi:2'-5' RNA ligase|nr:hypothetical protein [Methylobacteriaceae bacterium]
MEALSTELAAHYDGLYRNAAAAFISGNHRVDPLIDAPDDNRRGLTLLIRPGSDVTRNIRQFLTELRGIEPNQYYYPDTDIHITVISIISCYDGFDLRQIAAADYTDAVRTSLAGCPAFDLHMRGVTASPEAVMVCGLFCTNELNAMRAKLRNTFRRSPLRNTLDARYILNAAHATVFRLRRAPENPKRLLDLLEANRSRDFGTFTVGEVELVFNDWYQRHDKVVVLERFALRAGPRPPD